MPRTNVGTPGPAARAGRLVPAGRWWGGYDARRADDAAGVLAAGDRAGVLAADDDAGVNMASDCGYAGKWCKKAAEVARVGVDFAGLLKDGEALTGSPTVTPDPAGPTVSGVAIDGTSVVCLVAGGTAGTDYTLTFSAATSGGQTRTPHGTLQVK